MPATSATRNQEAAAYVLATRQVTKIYRLGSIDVPAVRGVNLSVAPGEFIALAGSSGSGKTTMLNLLGCVDIPTRGEVYVNGIATSNLDSYQLSRLRAKRIGFVFQTFNLIPTLSALENVEYPLGLLGYPIKQRREMAAGALAQVGLEKLLKRKPAEMSGGQRQRVAIARAMVKKPIVILADEPTANLDKNTAVEILDLMMEVNRTQNITFVFSSHDPAILCRANRVFRLIDGTEDQIYYWPESLHAV